MNNSGQKEQTVVIVDDSRTSRAVLESAMEVCGDFRVLGVAGDAESAAHMVRTMRPDIMTIDLCMPYIDGAALLEMLSDVGETCKIVVSENAANNVLIAAKLCSLGAAACVAKSALHADPKAFLRKLNAIVAEFDGRAPARSRDAAGDPAPQPAMDSPFAFPVPADERQRLDYLRRKKLANAIPERQFDLLTRHVARLSTFPVCLMTFIDKDTQWLKSSYGLPTESMPRCEAFCNYTISQDEAFVVRNAANDATFAHNPLVLGDPHIRTYVGHPIITAEGIHVGALCLIDVKVRVVGSELIRRLKDVAEIAAEMINQRMPLAA